jgi:hypothetical protein
MLGAIALVVLAASCDEASNPLAPDMSPRGNDVVADGSSLWIDEAIVPDALKLAALLGPSASLGAPSAALRSAIISRDGLASASIVSLAEPTYLALGVPFAPEKAPEANAGPACDDCVMRNVPLGFPFTFYGNTFTSIEISSNGFVGFGTGTDVKHGCCGGEVIPTSTSTETNLTALAGGTNLIALAWTDWNPTLGGTIRYETRGTAPNRQFIVQWTDIQEYRTAGLLTAQLVLSEASGDITMYTTSQSSTQHFVTQGIQNSTGTAAVFIPGRVKAQYALANDAVRFTTHRPDSESPVLHAPSAMTVNATMPSGAVVDFDVTATDNEGVTSLTCDPATGSTFAIGDHAATCTAADAAGNSASATFAVRVLGAPDQIVNLLEYIRKAPIPTAQKTQLVSTIQRMLTDPRSSRWSCPLLNLLIAKVQATPASQLPADRGAHIIADAKRIKHVLACP